MAKKRNFKTWLAVAVILLVFGCGIVSGAQRYFTVDDFEDDANNEDLWADWYSGSALLNGASITLWSTPPQIIDEHSMKYAYLNWFDFLWGYFSEVQTKNLQPNDWDSYDVQVISLWFYGQSGNDAAINEQMYLGLEDDVNYGEVKYGDAEGEDITDIQIEDWQQWAILTSNSGFAAIDFNNVTKICLGFGIRYGSSPGGYGTVYFDDIGLHYRIATVYVDADAAGANNGTNWQDAFNYLQDALAIAEANDQIWVAEGTYKPDANTTNPGGTSQREATFQLISGVAIYGGFAGGKSSLDERDIELYETILSGDLDENDIDVNDPCDLLNEPTRKDNSYTVVTGSATDLTAVLDGFTISGGIAIGPTPGHVPDICGGGMYNSGGSPTASNCTFRANAAAYRGGGMDNVYSSNPHVSNCTFSGNTAGDEGGGLENNYASSPTVRNCIFSGNSAINNGGGMNNDNPGTSPIVTNCIFTGNSAFGLGGGGLGGGMRNATGCSPILTNCTFSHNRGWGGANGIGNGAGSTTVTNSIFWDGGDEIVIDSGGSVTVNYSNVQGGWSGPGTENIDEDPLLIDPNGLDGIPGTADDEEGYVHLRGYSPCINAGDPGGDYSGQVDVDNQPRVAYGRVDMGADEVYPIAGDVEPDGDVDFGDFAYFAEHWLLGP
jgi:hypothetical protein